MFKLPAKIKLITVDVQIDLICMESLPGALCVAVSSLWFSFRAFSTPGTVAAAVTCVTSWAGLHWVMVFHGGLKEMFFFFSLVWLIMLTSSLSNRIENVPRILVRDSFLLG